MEHPEVSKAGTYDNDSIEELDSPSSNHRMAAYHFNEAAREHELAADAFDAGDQNLTEIHSFRAYRHQLNAVQYSEIAYMEAFDIN